MKRVLSLLLTTVLAVTLFTACSGDKSISTGLGVTTNIKKTVAPKSNNDGTAQVDSVVAAITLDNDGRIVKLSIDSPQTKVTFNKEGVITSGLSALVRSKREKGDDYGMKSSSGIGKEWYEQITAFEDWATGKTIDEVMSLNTKKVDDAHLQVPDTPELASSVTITVGDYMKAIEKAAANAKPAKTSETFKTGLGVVTKISNSKDATADTDGHAQVDSMIAVVTVNNKGKISACSIDTAQTIVAFTASGELSTDLNAEIKTIVELGDNYGLKETSAIGKEWYEQAAAFADWTIGKTMKEVQGIKTKKVDDNHPAVPDVPELASLVSIDIGDFITAIEKAVANAK